MSYTTSKAVEIELLSSVKNRTVFNEEFIQWKRDYLEYRKDSKKESTAYLDLFYDVLDLVDTISRWYDISKNLHSFDRHTRLLVAQDIAQEVRASV